MMVSYRVMAMMSGVIVIQRMPDGMCWTVETIGL